MRTVKIVYQTVSEGDDIGEATIRIDATTVGLGIVDEETVRIKQGDTAAQTVLQMLEDCGYEAGYDGLAEKNGGFYLMRLTRGDLLYRAQVPERLWTLIQRDGISLTGAPAATASASTTTPGARAGCMMSTAITPARACRNGCSATATC